MASVHRPLQPCSDAPLPLQFREPPGFDLPRQLSEWLIEWSFIGTLTYKCTRPYYIIWSMLNPFDTGQIVLLICTNDELHCASDAYVIMQPQPQMTLLTKLLIFVICAVYTKSSISVWRKQVCWWDTPVNLLKMALYNYILLTITRSSDVAMKALTKS